uniref:Uncharacterized protein n=1 Tax=Micrurus spixii TaxID=129469 RepID=A0A2D4L7W3_9SAUR
MKQKDSLALYSACAQITLRSLLTSADGSNCIASGNMLPSCHFPSPSPQISGQVIVSFVGVREYQATICVPLPYFPFLCACFREWMNLIKMSRPCKIMRICKRLKTASL